MEACLVILPLILGAFATFGGGAPLIEPCFFIDGCLATFDEPATLAPLLTGDLSLLGEPFVDALGTILFDETTGSDFAIACPLTLRPLVSWDFVGERFYSQNMQSYHHRAHQKRKPASSWRHERLVL